MVWELEIIQVTLPSERELDLEMAHGAKDLSRIDRTKLAANRLSRSKV